MHPSFAHIPGGEAAYLEQQKNAKNFKVGRLKLNFEVG
jgi:hypothetical protein